MFTLISTYYSAPVLFPLQAGKTALDYARKSDVRQILEDASRRALERVCTPLTFNCYMYKCASFQGYSLSAILTYTY